MYIMNINPLYLALAAATFLILILTILFIVLLVSRSHSPLSEIQQKLGSLQAAATQMQEIGKEVSSLKSILHAPKLRGNFGEYLLYSLLKDTLPPKNFAVQYQFSDGSAVDAIIRLGKNIIPVDSKFPLESFERYLTSKDSESKRRQKLNSPARSKAESTRFQKNISARRKALLILRSCTFQAKASTTKS